MRVVSQKRLSAVVSLVFMSAAAQGANIPWINPLGGNFSSAINWLGGILPGSSDVAAFDIGLPSTYTTTFSGNAANSQISVSSDILTLDLQGHSYTLGSSSYEAGGYSAQIGGLLGGTLNLTNSSSATGTFATQYASIAALATDTGTVSVSGSHTAWNSATAIYAGDSGNGTLNITNGATVSDLIGTIGNEAGSKGNATVDGAGSNWTSYDYFYVGGYGTGNLTIQNGAAVNSAVSYVGQYGPGTATVTGAGTTWNAGYLDVAYGSSGSLTISNGASVTDSDGYVSCSPDSPGVVTVTGANSTWTNTDTLYVGLGGGTTVNIGAGATVSVSHTFGMANKPGNQINLSGGTLRVGILNTMSNPSLILGNGLTTGWTSGTLDITMSNVTIGSGGPLGTSLTLGAGKTLQVTGSGDALSIASGSTLNVAGGSLYANTLNNAGTLSVPAGSTAEIVNPLVNTGLIDISGGKLQLDGDTPASVRSQIASAFDHGSWDGTTGITSSAAQANPQHDTAIGYITSGSTTNIFYTWYGDANGDGVVNGLDALAMSDSGTTWQTGDFNYDGKVNADDYSLFELGVIYGSKNILTLVPEPTTLICLAPIAVMLRRRRA